MNMRARIDYKSPRFSYLCGYTRYWGYSNFCETCDYSYEPVTNPDCMLLQ
jgi:hypothetical protein